MAEFYNDRSLLQGSTVPQFDVGALAKAGALTQQALGSIRDRELAEAEEKKEQTRWDIQNARAEALAKRQEDEYQRGIAKETATNEALKATLNPTAYQDEKMAGEQNAIQQSLAALNPQDRAIAEGQLKAGYNPNASREQWLNTALGAENADQSKVLSTKKSVYDIAVNTPDTPEYKAKVDAEWNEYIKKQNYIQGLQNDAEKRKQAKEDTRVDALLKGLTTSTTGTKEVITDNAGSIEATNKFNQRLTDKARKYGETLKENLTDNKDINRLDSIMAGLQKDIETEQVKADMVGGKSPKASELTNKLNHYTKMRDDLFGRLDSQAKSEVGLDELYQSKFIKPVEYKQFKDTEDTKLSKEEWLKSALQNAKNAGTTGLTAILSQAEKLYPTVNNKERAKLVLEKETAEDLKNLIQKSTGKPAVSSTKEGLEKELAKLWNKAENNNSTLNKALLGVRTDEGFWKVNNERIDANDAVKAAKKNNPKLADTTIAAAVAYATDEDKDFDVDMFNDYLDIK